MGSKKIRNMHSPPDPNTPTDSSNFASLRESHQKAHKGNDRASFHVPGHDSVNYDTQDHNLNNDLVPMYHNTVDQSDDHRGSRYNYSDTNSRSAGYTSSANDGPSKSTSKNRRNSTSLGFMHNATMGPDPPHHMPHVPFSGLHTGANVAYTKQLYCDDGESDDTQWVNLEKVAEKDIPHTWHRNGSTLKDTEKFDTELPCMSVQKFIIPPLSAFTEESCMGRKYECNILPTKTYEDIPLMCCSGKEDLIHMTQKDTTLASMIVTSCPDMYIELHNILRLQVQVLAGKMAPTKMTQYKTGLLIVCHVDSCQEDIIQSSITGHTFSKFEQYKVMSQGLQRFLRNACDDKAITMIR